MKSLSRFLLDAIYGLDTLGGIAMGIPQINAIVTPILASVSSALASIPVLGWVAIGILVAAVVTVLDTEFMVEMQAKGLSLD